MFQNRYEWLIFETLVLYYLFLWNICYGKLDPVRLPLARRLAKRHNSEPDRTGGTRRHVANFGLATYPGTGRGRPDRGKSSASESQGAGTPDSRAFVRIHGRTF